MAEEIFTPGVGELLKELTVLVADQIKLAWGVKGDLKKLQKTLSMIQNVLQDADDNQQANHKQVGEWLKRLKDVAFDAEDVMDEFSYEDLRRRLEIQNRLKSTLRNFFSRSNPCAFRWKMAHKIKDINAAFDEIVEDMKKLEIIRRNTVIPAPAGDLNETNSNRETTSTVALSEIVGRKEDKEKLVDMLLIDPRNEDDQLLSVIPIVGIGGLGKTTLAQLVYNDVQVQTHFTDLKMWVCVSDDFNVKKLVGDIIESAGESRLDSASTLEAMADKLRQKLGGKKFLLVLDDVWNDDRDLWDAMRKPLLCGAKGSKIIVTTRSNEVANIMGTLPVHRLPALSDDESWLLFKQRAFGVSQRGGAEETQELVAIGKKIVEKCKGVPLAVKAIGGMLSSKRGKTEWLSILNNDLWRLPDDKNKIFQVLRLSYDHLPSHLKRCFSFCSIFLKDEFIKVERLIRLWMAEGLLQTVQKENMQMEDVGYEYFQELFSKSFFQLYKDKEERPGDKIDYCKMHDLFHDLAQLISRFECCVFDAKKKNDISNMRRLRIELELSEEEEEETAEIPKELGTAKKLRVLCIQGFGRRKIGNVSLLMNLKSLRVLSLQSLRIWNEELADMIAKLKHLRYLEIGDVEEYDDVLTKCIARLYHLQTIKVTSWVKLKLFPRIENLINLRHLDIRYGRSSTSSMPKGIGKLRFLQSLSVYQVGTEKGRRIEGLKELDQIRGELRVEGLENVKSREEAMKANLKQKRFISKLDLHWSEERENNNYDDVLEGLEPHPDLKELNIKGFKGVRWPRWLTHQMLPNLVSVSLDTSRNCKDLPAFGLFASLQSLKITGMDSLQCIGIEFYRGTVARSPPPSFPCLKTLELHCLWNLEEWVELPASSSSSPSSLSSSFPSLEILTIKHCPKLRTMPTFFPSIRNLNLRYSDSVVEMMLGKCEDDDEEENSNNIRELIPTFSTNLRQLFLNHDTFPSLPKCIQYFTALENLVICDFPNMEALPEWLGNLTSLQRLLIQHCNRLAYLPSAEAIRRLCKLDVVSVCCCPRLSERCTRDQGQEWYKISHLRYLPMLGGPQLSCPEHGDVACSCLCRKPIAFTWKYPE